MVELSYVLPSHLLPTMAKFALHPGWIATADKEPAIFVRQGNPLGQQDGSGVLNFLDKAVVSQDPRRIRGYLNAGTYLKGPLSFNPVET